MGLATPAAAAPHRHLPKPQVGEASFYGARHAGKTMANGEPMVPGKMIAASKALPLGAVAKVTNLENGKSVRVEVTDRGPHEAGRVIDVSPKAAEKLDMKDDGVARVKVEPVSTPGPTR